MNIQCVASEDFNAYLMKYVGKAKCRGSIDTRTASESVEVAHPDLTKDVRVVVAAYRVSHVEGPCEAALVLLLKQLLGIAHVSFVYSRPPSHQNMPSYIPAPHSC